MLLDLEGLLLDFVDFGEFEGFLAAVALAEGVGEGADGVEDAVGGADVAEFFVDGEFGLEVVLDVGVADGRGDNKMRLFAF